MGKIDLYQLLAELARAARKATLTLYQQAVEVARRQRQATETVAQETAEVAQRARKVTERVLQEVAEVCWREASPQQTEKLFQLVAEICYLHGEVDMSKWRIVDVNGVERDLQGYFNFYVEEYRGMDSPEVQVFGTPYATLPGEVADGERVLARDMFLTGTLIAGSEQSLHRYRASLLDNLKPWRAGQTTWNSDTIRLRYVGQFRTIEINVKFLGDYGGTRRATDNCTQKLTLHFRAQEDVWWHETSDRTVALDGRDDSGVVLVVGKVGGLWTNLGPPAGVTPVLGTALVSAMAHDGDYLYIGGIFANYDNNAGLDYVARWDGAAWSAMGPASAGTGAVNAMLLLPDGRIVIGGDFLNWGGAGTADYAVIYDPTTNTYAAMAAGPGDVVNDLALDPLTGNLLAACGTTGVLSWNGAAWTALGLPFGVTNYRSICFTPDGTLYLGGDFVDGLGDDYLRLRRYLPETDSWQAITNGSIPMVDDAGTIYSVRSLSDGRIVVGGDFTNIGADAFNNVAIYNGQRLLAMNGGFNALVRGVFVNAEDVVYIVGDFTAEVQTIYTNIWCTIAGVAIWRGATWYPLDAIFTGGADIYAIAFDDDDVYFAGDPEKPISHSGDTTVSLVGAGRFYPRVVITADNGATLYYIENTLSNSQIWFNDLYILPGETVTIDFQNKRITSNFGAGATVEGVAGGDGRRFAGQPRAGSDFGSFFMAGGDNVLNLFMDTTTGVTARLLYRAAYDGIAGAELP